MMNHASKGDWGMPQQAARDSGVAIQVHCLPVCSASLKWAFFRVIVWARGEFA